MAYVRKYKCKHSAVMRKSKNEVKEKFHDKSDGTCIYEIT